MLQGLLNNPFWRAVYPLLLYGLFIECIYGLIPEVGFLFATAMAAVPTTMLCIGWYRKDCKITAGSDKAGSAEKQKPYGLTVLAAMAGLSFCIVGSCLSYMAMRRFGGGSDGGYGESATALLGIGLGLTVLCTGIVIPIAEEFVFRAMMYPRLKDCMKQRSAAVLSAVAFGLYHGSLYQGIYAGIMGLLLVDLLERYHSMKGPLVFHIAANLTALFLNYTSVGVMIGKNAITLWLTAGFSLVGTVVFVYLLKNQRGYKK